MLFSTVPRKVLMPNTRAHSSFVSDEAIWKLWGARTFNILSTALQIQLCQQHTQVYCCSPVTLFFFNSVHHQLSSTSLQYFLWDLRGDWHQELVEASEEDVSSVTDPNVVRGPHEEQQARLDRCDNTDNELRPELPANLDKACRKGSSCTCRKKYYKLHSTVGTHKMNGTATDMKLFYITVVLKAVSDHL